MAEWFGCWGSRVSVGAVSDEPGSGRMGGEGTDLLCYEQERTSGSGRISMNGARWRSDEVMDVLTSNGAKRERKRQLFSRVVNCLCGVERKQVYGCGCCDVGCGDVESLGRKERVR